MSAENSLTAFRRKICDLDVEQLFIPRHLTEKKKK